MGRQHDLGMDNTALSGIVMGLPVPFVCQFCPAPVSGSFYGRPALAALDDLDGEMAEIYWYNLLSSGDI